MFTAKNMSVVGKYRGHNINYIDSFQWYAVFVPKGDGTSSMHHFSSEKEAKNFLDEQKEKPEKNFWWEDEKNN